MYLLHFLSFYWFISTCIWLLDKQTQYQRVSEQKESLAQTVYLLALKKLDIVSCALNGGTCCYCLCCICLFCVLQITAMYIDGHLKGGFQTVEAYAGFCGYFKNWLDTKSIKLSVPRQGELVAEDYRACLEYVNSEVTDVLNIQILCQYFTDQIAHLKDFYFRWRFCFVLDVKGKKCHNVFLGEVVSLLNAIINKNKFYPYSLIVQTKQHLC